MEKRYVLFVCGHNSGRSQMGKGYFNSMKKYFPLADESYEAISGGNNPETEISSTVAAACREAHIYLDDPDSRPKGLRDPYIQERLPFIERLVIACDDRSCLSSPDFRHIQPGRIEHWDLPDPHSQPLETVRGIRDMVREKVWGYLNRLNSELQLPV